MIEFLEAVFAIIGLLTTLFVVVVAVSGDSIVKYLEATAQELQSRNEQRRKEQAEEYVLAVRESEVKSNDKGRRASVSRDRSDG